MQTNIEVETSRNMKNYPVSRVACEQALWSEKEPRKQTARTSEETGRGGEGKGGGKREGGESVDKGLKPPYHPLVIDPSSIVQKTE